MEEKVELNDEFLDKFFLMLESKGLVVKEAVVRTQRKDYVKEKDFVKFVEDNGELVRTELNKAFVMKIKTENNPSDLSKNILKVLLEKKILVQTVPIDYESKVRYPKRLVIFNEEDKIEEENDNEEDVDKPSRKIRMFYIMNFKRKENKSYTWLIIIVTLVLLFCLLPVWPLELKLTVWWISYILLIFFVSNFIFKFLIIYQL